MSMKTLLDDILIAIMKYFSKKELSKYVHFPHVSFSISALHFQRDENKFTSDKMHLEPSLYA